MLHQVEVSPPIALKCLQTLQVKEVWIAAQWEASSSSDKFKMDNTPWDPNSTGFLQHKIHRVCFKINQDSMETLRLFTPLNTNCCFKIWNKTTPRSQLMDTKCKANKTLFSRTTCSLTHLCTTPWALAEELWATIKQRKTCGELQIFQKNKDTDLQARSWLVTQLPLTCIT